MKRKCELKNLGGMIWIIYRIAFEKETSVLPGSTQVEKIGIAATTSPLRVTDGGLMKLVATI